MSTITRYQTTNVKSEISSFRDLIAWQKGMDLICDVYKMTLQLPDHEKFGLISQMRRAAVSISSNIAEGWGRDSTQEYIRFLNIARASACEISTQAEVCKRLEYSGNWSEIIEQSEEVGRIINGLIKSLRKYITKAKTSNNTIKQNS